MKKLLFILLIISLNINAQSFPEKCIGQWTGKMLLFNSKKKVNPDSLSISLTVKKIDSLNAYIWRTEYLSTEHQIVKDYKLVPTDNENEFFIDEGNDIKLLNFNYDNKLYSMFGINDLVLTATYEITPKGLLFEVVSGKRTETKAEVENYKITAVQKVLLHKVAKEKDNE